MIAESPIHVLLVEDSPTDAMLALDALKPHWKFDVAVTDRLGKAQELCAERPFDVVLLDLGLPDSQGLETLLKIRRGSRTVPVVVMTGRDDEDLAYQLAHEGAQDYLIKSQLHDGSLRRSIRQAIVRKRADDESCSRAESFRSAFEHTNIAMALTDLNHRFVRVNTAFADMFGYSETDILKMSMPDITHPEDLTENFMRREALVSGKGQHLQVKKRYRHRDGRLLWGLTNVSVVRDTHDQPRLYFRQVQNISEQRQAEAANGRCMEHLRILHLIDNAALTGDGSADIALTALAPLRTLLGVRAAALNLYNPDKSCCEWLSMSERRDMQIGPGIPYSMRFVKDVEGLHRGDLQWVDVHLLKPSPQVDALLTWGIHAYVVMPMIVAGELIGTLSLGGPVVHPDSACR